VGLSFVLGGVLLSLLGEANELLADLIPGILILGWPVALGIAILRYRLYDIDRLINRTLVYGLLTALLAGVYAGAVLALGARSSAGWAEILRAGRWPGRPWRWPPWSGRLAAASKRSWTAA
jgi:hypothetical protein